MGIEADVDLTELRRRAEDAVGGGEEREAPEEARAATEDGSLQGLLHELEQREVELEMQNEELWRARAELEEARDRYFDLYELAPVAYMTLRRTGHVEAANLTAASLFGVARSELLGRPLGAFLEEAEADRLHLHLRDVFERGVKQRCELSLRRRDDVRMPVFVDSVATTASGQPRCLSALIDLSEKKKAEEELRDREAWLRAVFDTAVDGLVTIDAEGKIQSLNRAAAEMFGWEPGELVGRPVECLMPEPNRSHHAEYLARYLATGEARAMGPRREVVGLRRDGSQFPLELGIGEVKIGGQAKFVGVLRDITSRKRKDQALRDSLQRFRQIAERVEDVFYVSQATAAQVLYLSPAFDTIWGRPAESCLGEFSRMLATIHPEDRRQVQLAMERLHAGGVFDQEYRIIRPDGTARVVRDRAFPGGGGQITGIVQDVTEERELEEELRQSQKMEAIGALASGIAHDFNNLLMGIIGFNKIAARSLDQPRVAAELMGESVQAAERGASLTRQLLTFSRRRAPRQEALELDALLSGSRRLLATLLGEHIRMSLRAGAPGRHVLADAGELSQILMNLAANARDAMPNGGELEVCTEDYILSQEIAERRHVQAGRFVRLSMRDTGTGMDEATRSRVFEPFFTTKKVGEGTGLGLSTSFAIVHRLGGWIAVDSAPGWGTEFRIYLPVLDREAVAAPVLEGAPPETPRGDGTVLLVEDEPLVRLTVERYLEGLGYEVLVAGTVDEALSACERREGRVDALVTDVVMPGNMGTELAAALRSRCPGLRVLYMSACGEEELQAFGRLEPGAHLLEKPFDERTLAVALEEVFSDPAPGADGQLAAGESSERTTLLLVEDSAASRLAMQDCLEAFGYRVLASGWPSEALELARSSPIDLVITDSTLPEMGGDELLAALRRIRPGTPAIVISGYPSWEIRTPERFLQKPVDFKRLRDTIESALGRS